MNEWLISELFEAFGYLASFFSEDRGLVFFCVYVYILMIGFISVELVCLIFYGMVNMVDENVELMMVFVNSFAVVDVIAACAFGLRFVLGMSMIYVLLVYEFCLCVIVMCLLCEVVCIFCVFVFWCKWNYVCGDVKITSRFIEFCKVVFSRAR